VPIGRTPVEVDTIYTCVILRRKKNWEGEKKKKKKKNEIKISEGKVGGSITPHRFLLLHHPPSSLFFRQNWLFLLRFSIYELNSFSFLNCVLPLILFHAPFFIVR
jgi:hypothetical protein